MGWFEDISAQIGNRVPPDGGRRVAPGGPSGPGRGSGGGNVTSPPATLPGVMPGWDPTKWANASHQTPKYAVGRILAKYPPTVEGLKQAMPELQAAFPGIQFNGKDTLTGIPGLGPMGIDVLQGASNGGVAWQWIDKDQEAAQPSGLPQLFNLPSNASTTWGGGGGAFGGGGGDAGGGGGGGDQRLFQAPAFESLPGFQGPDVPDAAAPWVPSAFTPAPITPGEAPPAFNYGGPAVPGEYAGPNALNAARGGPSMASRPEFTYDPLKTSEAFVMPTGQEALAQDPGYQFRLSQGLKARESSAAARGLLRTGATLKGLDEFGQELASQEYGKAFDRSFNTYGLNQGVRQSEQAQQFGQRLGAEQQNAAQRLNEFNAQLASQGQEFQHAATQQGMNEAQRLAAYQANLARQQQGFTQGFSAANLNSDNANRYADRNLQAQTTTQANALAANNAANAFGFQAAGWNADQRQQRYRNQLERDTTGYNFAQQQNLAKNAQAMQGYQTDVNRDLAQQGINLTANQNAFMNSLNGQQQQWMQMYMMNGQSFDQAYKMLLAQLQYPA